MSNKKIIIYISVIFIIGLIIGVTININSENSENNGRAIKSEDVNDSKHEKIVSGYSFEVIDKNVINKEFDGTYLNRFVTVVDNHDEYEINVSGIPEENNVYIINPMTGEMTNLEYNNGIFSLKTKLEKDINYGILNGYGLVGSIRVVDNIDSINSDKLFNDILIGLGCGL